MRSLVSRRGVALATTVCAGLALTGSALTPIRATAAPAGARPAAEAFAPATDRGTLAAPPVHLTTLSAAEVRTALAKAGFEQDSVRYGVALYRLLYRTVDADGRPTVASGLIVLPRSGDRRPRIVSFTHGTQSYKEDAPSIGKDDFSSSPAMTFGAAGFAAVTPDYLGLGEGPGTHPWMDVPSETTASLDMLRAARAFMAGRGMVPQRRVLVTGFSQGASAALGLARALQDGADRWYRLGAVAPISGGYAFRDAELPALLAGKEIPPKLGVAYTTYLLVSWNRLHHLYDSPGEVFQAPYAGKVDRLFDGTTPGQEMLAALPGSLDELLTSRGRAMLEHPTGAFAKALRVADGTCTGWVPRAPIRLYYAAGDEQAVTANTDHCRAAFRASGVNLTPIDLGPTDYQGSRHLGTAVTGTAAIVDWFTRLPA
ncbi:alpha/beta hydrolase family protein [Actinoallomurus sp. CA-150999]|uniref:alpha/beta hydrolase family protein n=1 Tax=Actinoallomurus sp. CA-150999 TaxID=3239887 RepID=UPI003D937649